MMSRIAAKKFVFSFATFVALALSLFVSVPVYAQVTGATLTGTVMDASGAVIPDAKISVTDVATGTNRTTTTGTAGFYTVPNLDPATYQVTASAPGFSTLKRRLPRNVCGAGVG